jgi:hypothetical protein
MPKTHFFRIPDGISHPVILQEGSQARVIELDEARGLTDDSEGKVPEARWLNAQLIRSNRGKLTLKKCERTNDRSSQRGLSLTLSPTKPLSKRGGDFRRGRYHRFLDDLASGAPYAAAFANDLRTKGPAL